MEDNKNMKRKWYHLLIFLGVVGAYIGLLSCGKSQEIVDVSTVLLERGQHIIYGSYQGEAIEWRVLDKKGDEVLLISEYGLDAQPYDTSGKKRVLWKDSTIRKWLNDDFYNSAFSEDEKENIVLSSSEGFEEYNGPVYLTSEKPYAHLERETEDKLFFLSYTELVAYFAKDPCGGYYSDHYGHSEILCYPTEYAKQNLKPLYKTDTCGWWLCNPQFDTGDGVSDEVEIISAFGEWSVASMMDTRQYAVRPAMWVTWQNDMQVIDEK